MLAMRIKPAGVRLIKGGFFWACPLSRCGKRLGRLGWEVELDNKIFWRRCAAHHRRGWDFEISFWSIRFVNILRSRSRLLIRGYYHPRDANGLA